MTVGYYTDNNVSHSVMKAFSRSGVTVRHIDKFDKTQPAIFYGILRGNGAAMRHHQYQGIDCWYVDNGYFDAQYMDLMKHKNMTGKYRVVKNAMLEKFPLLPSHQLPLRKVNILVLPPSPYSAFMHDTTPDDWKAEWVKKLQVLGHNVAQRTKDDQQPLARALKAVDAVLAFNSMGIMAAVDHGKAVYTTHGIFDNADMIDKCLPYYDIEELRKFYEPKQFTLEEIAEGKACLS